MSSYLRKQKYFLTRSICKHLSLLKCLIYSSQDIQEMLLCLRFNLKNCVLKITIWRRNSIECFLYSLWFVASYVSNWRQKLMDLGETTSLVIRYRVYSWLKGPPPQCHAFPIFSFLFKKKKQTNLIARLIIPNLVNTRSFVRTHWKLMEIWDPQVCHFCKDLHAIGQALVLWHAFFCKKKMAGLRHQVSMSL